MIRPIFTICIVFLVLCLGVGCTATGHDKCDQRSLVYDSESFAIGLVDYNRGGDDHVYNYVSFFLQQEGFNLEELDTRPNRYGLRVISVRSGSQEQADQASISLFKEIMLDVGIARSVFVFPKGFDLSDYEALSDYWVDLQSTLDNGMNLSFRPWVALRPSRGDEVIHEICLGTIGPNSIVLSTGPNYRLEIQHPGKWFDSEYLITLTIDQEQVYSDFIEARPRYIPNTELINLGETLWSDDTYSLDLSYGVYSN